MEWTFQNEWTGAATRRCYVKQGVLRNFAKFTVKHVWWSFFFNKIAGLRAEKETLTQVFYFDVCETFKNNFFYRAPPVAAS